MLDKDNRDGKLRDAAYVSVGGVRPLNSKTAALYCRVAAKDDDIITEQEDNLRRFAYDMGFSVKAAYSDNGVSGSSLDRPAFNAMMSVIENRSVDCVITKDFARISRSFIQVGEWLDSMSDKGVRIISVNDSFDSFAFGGDMAATFVETFKTAYREALSAKTKTGIAYKYAKEAAK